LKFTLGSKFEHNDYTGYEVQPNIRMLWHPAKNHSFWAAASRAVRTPSRGEREGNLFVAAIPPLTASNPTAITFRTEMRGTENSVSESVLSYEAGYRIALGQYVNFDLCGFYNQYFDLISGQTGEPIIDENYPDYMIFPISIINGKDLNTKGAEFALDVATRSNIRLRTYYSYFWNDEGRHSNIIDSSGSSPNNNLLAFETGWPTHQFGLQSYFTPHEKLNFYLGLKYVDELSAVGIDKYVSIDANITYQILPYLELYFSGRDLGKKEHTEFYSEMYRLSSEIKRRVYFGLKWTY